MCAIRERESWDVKVICLYAYLVNSAWVKRDSWPPLRGGCQRQLTGGVSFHWRYTPSTAYAVPLPLWGRLERC